MSTIATDSNEEAAPDQCHIRGQQSPCASEATGKLVIPYLADCLVGDDVISHSFFYDIRAANGEKK